MSENVILCVLNALYPDVVHENSSVHEILPREHLYRYEGDNSAVYSGIQANEAPIKYLIDSCHKQGNDVTSIFYLCSEKCLTATITAETLKHSPGFKSLSGDQTAESFLQARIDEYCSMMGYVHVGFTPIAYNPSKPADALRELIINLTDGYRVSIDITGGKRDAVMLLSMAAQVIRIGTEGSELGEVVYASLADGTITRQNNTFDMVDFISAIEGFIEYGRADRLDNFFGTRKKFTSPETKDLCCKMVTFSDALALCQVRHIDRKAKAVQDALLGTKNALERHAYLYALYSDAMEQMVSSSEIRERTFDEAMSEIALINPDLDFSAFDSPLLNDKLTELQKPHMLERNELLLLPLIPSIINKFINVGENDSDSVINLIEWCAKHQMIQQAFCIYRELICGSLVKKGYFIELAAFDDLDDSAKEDVIKDLLINCSIYRSGLKLVIDETDETGNKVKRDGRYRKVDHPYFRINDNKEPQLRTIFAWFRYLHAARNMVMHADDALITELSDYGQPACRV